ncbi:MAG: hypothetical protein HY556_08060 [Euryarchaeota archaeon]|nr:hypothetical protein [Euryarchaeota archaeon]
MTAIFGSGLASASHTANECADPSYSEVLCPDPTANGASCLSYGIVIIERDQTASLFGGNVLGDAVIDYSESRAWTWAIPGPWPPIPPPPHQGQPGLMAPPGDPSAHADANQMGVTYTNMFLGIGLDTKTVFSRCDVLAIEDPVDGLYTEAYGRAGVEDFELSLFGGTLQLNAEVLDYEEQAIGLPWVTWAAAACDVAELEVVPVTSFAYCPPPNSGLGALIVTVEVNEEWGPVPNSAGQWVYGGAALHVTVYGGVSQVDIYVGYVSVAVTGGTPMPPIWVSDPCLSGITPPALGIC